MSEITIKSLALAQAFTEYQQHADAMAKLSELFPEIGKPPSSIADDGTRKRRMTPKARSAVSLRMKKYWAARRKEKAKEVK